MLTRKVGHCTLWVHAIEHGTNLFQWLRYRSTFWNHTSYMQKRMSWRGEEEGKRGVLWRESPWRSLDRWLRLGELYFKIWLSFLFFLFLFSSPSTSKYLPGNTSTYSHTPHWCSLSLNLNLNVMIRSSKKKKGCWRSWLTSCLHFH